MVPFCTFSLQEIIYLDSMAAQDEYLLNTEAELALRAVSNFPLLPQTPPKKLHCPKKCGTRA